MMETLKTNYEKSKEFSRSVIEWRSTFTAPYLMIVNAIFWWNVFYANRELQLKLLMSIAGIVFGWDVLLTATHEHSVLVHLFLWPVNNLFRSASVALSLFSAHLLHSAELEKACWVAYCTVGLLMLNPVWRYQRVSERIFSALCNICCVITAFFMTYVARPCIVLFHIIKYIVLLRWVPVAYNFVKRHLLRFVRWLTHICTSFIDAVRQSVISVRNSIIRKITAICDCVISTVASVKRRTFATFLAVYNWIICSCRALSAAFHSLITRIINVIRSTKRNFCDTVLRLKQLIVDTVKSVKNTLLSTIFTIKNSIFEVIIKIRSAIISTCFAIRNAVIMTMRKTRHEIRSALTACRNAVILAVMNIFSALCSLMQCTKCSLINVRLAICEWIWRQKRAIATLLRELWETTKICTNRSVIEPCRTALMKIRKFLHYWLYAEWWPLLCEWFHVNVECPLRRLFNSMCYGLVYVFCGYWLKPTGELIKVWLKRLGAYLHRTITVPFKIWLGKRLDDLKKLLERMARAMLNAFMDSIFWPLCVIAVDLLEKLYGYFHKKAVLPMKRYLHIKYKLAERYTLIYVIGPTLEVIVNNIPEKSPFCDDSDTELAELLPETEDREEEETGASDTEGFSDYPQTPNRPISPVTEDERDFVKGLRFPAIEASESSDDEFSLENRHRKKHVRSHHPPAVRRAVPVDPEHDWNSGDEFLPAAEMPSLNAALETQDNEMSPNDGITAKSGIVTEDTFEVLRMH
ncbi:hypothetical protein AB6A40_006906 [Gnathostoma spinigerum]|uniref:Uncharacterized protein n=1 Tax=Gnathostoma spinigerum TaxID=75299 RepID=A0ABD6EUF9_9BILA